MIALVTGGNRGIGREICRQLAELGHTVVLSARSDEAARQAAGELNERLATPRVHPLRLDVTDAEQVAAVPDQLLALVGGLDVLINNAAITYDTWQQPSTADLGVVREAAETNLYGPWHLIQSCLPLLRASAHPRIVNVSSGAGSLSSMGAGTPAYAVTKVGLNALTRMFADELGRDGVLVNSVCPGWVATDMGGAGGRPVSEGAAGIVWAATLPDDGPSGGFFRDRQPVDW